MLSQSCVCDYKSRVSVCADLRRHESVYIYIIYALARSLLIFSRRSLSLYLLYAERVVFCIIIVQEECVVGGARLVLLAEIYRAHR